ncbi:MAG TPA: siderophore-interacting protein [Solirubrobacterales bacterium]|nr:siderophore-interacting protein [Solirubrobacterales bacterium]
MSPTPEKMSAKRTPPRVATVLRSERLTPQVIRITFGGPGLDGFAAGPFTDHYVKLHLPPAAAGYGPPFEIERVRAELPRERWPRVRTYSVRAWDRSRRELTIDFVDHGGDGVAGPWAAAARPGDPVQLIGPGGAYSPDPEADWHLLVGDTCVLPAIAVALARISAGTRAVVVAAVDGPEEEQPLETPGVLDLRWVHRAAGDELDPDPLVEAVRDLSFPPGRVHAFVHGEAGMVRSLRRHLLVDRSVAVEATSISGYWKRRRTEEGWRADKPGWKRQVEADLGPASSAG